MQQQVCLRSFLYAHMLTDVPGKIWFIASTCAMQRCWIKNLQRINLTDMSRDLKQQSSSGEQDKTAKHITLGYLQLGKCIKLAQPRWNLRGISVAKRRAIVHMPAYKACVRATCLTYSCCVCSYVEAIRVG